MAPKKRTLFCSIAITLMAAVIMFFITCVPQSTKDTPEYLPVLSADGYYYTISHCMMKWDASLFEKSDCIRIQSESKGIDIKASKEFCSPAVIEHSEGTDVVFFYQKVNDEFIFTDYFYVINSDFDSAMDVAIEFGENYLQ